MVRLKYQSKLHPGGLAKLFEYASLQESRVEDGHRQVLKIQTILSGTLDKKFIGVLAVWYELNFTAARIPKGTVTRGRIF